MEVGATEDPDEEPELELDDDPAHAKQIDTSRIPVVVTVSQVCPAVPAQQLFAPELITKPPDMTSWRCCMSWTCSSCFFCRQNIISDHVQDPFACSLSLTCHLIPRRGVHTL